MPLHAVIQLHTHTTYVVICYSQLLLSASFASAHLKFASFFTFDRSHNDTIMDKHYNARIISVTLSFGTSNADICMVASWQRHLITDSKAFYWLLVLKKKSSFEHCPSIV